MLNNVNDNYAVEQTSLILFQKAILALNERLKADPDNIQVKFKLIDFYRKLGNLKKAKELLESFSLDDLDAYHQNLLCSLAVIPPGLQTGNSAPSPFLLIHDFLSPSDLDQIWQLVSQNLNKARKSKVSGLDTREADSHSGLYDSKTRSSQVIGAEALKPIRDSFLALIKDQLPKIKAQLLLTDYIQPKRRELQLTRHQHGDFYGLHQDISHDKNKAASARKFTFVYYFFKEPKAFDGGDLLLYDANTKDGLLNNTFTRIIPENNTVVFFPSDRFHQVTTINSEGRDMEHSRFTLNGWFH